MHIGRMYCFWYVCMSLVDHTIFNSIYMYVYFPCFFGSFCFLAQAAFYLLYISMSLCKLM